VQNMDNSESNMVKHCINLGPDYLDIDPPKFGDFF